MTTAPQADRSGIVLMIAAIFMFSAMDAMAKFLSDSFATEQIVWARYTGQVVLTLAWLRGRSLGLLRTRHLGLQGLRSGLLFAATFCFFTALSRMDIAAATALINVHPVLLTLGAALILGEGLGPRRLFGVVAALAGALIVIRPGAEVFSPAALLPLMAGLCYAGYALSTRALGRDEPILTSFLYTALVGAVLASVLVLPVWRMPDAGEALFLLAVGAAGSVGQFCLIRALTVAEAGVVAPFGYAGVVFATCWGVLVFGERPDVWTILGAVVIVGAGLYVWHRETEAKRQTGQG